MICPGCSAEMSEESYHGVQLDLCSSCPGVWFDWGELEAYNKNGGPDEIRGVPGPKATFEPTGGSTQIKCPCCQRDLLRTGTVGRHKVIRCTTCGGLFLPLPDPDVSAGNGRGVLKAAIRTLQELVSIFV